MAERAFVIIPLADIAPQFLHPILNKSVSELLSKIDQTGISEYSSEGCNEKSD
jgi:7,8-dihydro-6-hydroxymethylpterin-pyrophosphokinase